MPSSALFAGEDAESCCGDLLQWTDDSPSGSGVEAFPSEEQIRAMKEMGG